MIFKAFRVSFIVAFTLAFASVAFSVNLSIFTSGFSIVTEEVKLSRGENLVSLSLKPNPTLVFVKPSFGKAIFSGNSFVRIEADTAGPATLLYFTRAFDWKANHLADLSGSFQSVAVINASERFEGNVSLCWGVYEKQVEQKGPRALMASAAPIPRKSETLRCLELGRTSLEEGLNELSLLTFSTTWDKLCVLETYDDVHDQPLKAKAVSRDVLSTDLPPGEVYVFDGGIFAGVVRLNGMAKGQHVEMTYGDVYDVRGSRTTVEVRKLKTAVEKRVRFTVHNYGDETREIVVIDHVPEESKIVTSDIPSERPSAGIVVFRFELGGGKAISFGYEYRVEYR